MNLEVYEKELLARAIRNWPPARQFIILGKAWPKHFLTRPQANYERLQAIPTPTPGKESINALPMRVRQRSACFLCQPENQMILR